MLRITKEDTAFRPPKDRAAEKNIVDLDPPLEPLVWDDPAPSPPRWIWIGGAAAAGLAALFLLLRR